MVEKRISCIVLVIASLALLASIIISGCGKITGNAVSDIPDSDAADSSTASDSVEDNVECYKDSDCGEDIIGVPYCFQGNILTPKTLQKCLYKGTKHAECVAEKKDEITLCKAGNEDCHDGRCIVISESPCNDNDGGKKYYVAGTLIDGLSETYSDECKDERWLMERYCSIGTKGEGLTEYEFCDKGCKDGACIR